MYHICSDTIWEPPTDVSVGISMAFSIDISMLCSPNESLYAISLYTYMDYCIYVIPYAMYNQLYVLYTILLMSYTMQSIADNTNYSIEHCVNVPDALYKQLYVRYSYIPYTT